MTVPADFYPDQQVASARVPWAVTDPAEIAGIEARIRYGALPWWSRALTEPPPGWPSTPVGRAFRRALDRLAAGPPDASTDPAAAAPAWTSAWH